MMRLAVLLLSLAACSSQQAASFWLTDSSLFRAPLQQAAQQLFGQQQSTEGKEQLQAAEQQQAAAAAGGASSQVELLAKSSEPWLRVEPAIVSAAKQIQQIPQQQQQELPAAQSAFAALQFQQQQQCQCNADWLRNQTGAYLNKWLSSPNVAGQMRLLLLAPNSTGGQLRANASGSLQEQSHRRRDAHHNGNGANNHWAAWIRSKGSNANGSQVRTARNKPESAQPATSKPPERGPKGEQGARGERGPSGLISVKDRNGLFDLPAPTNAASFASPDTTATGGNSSGDKQGAEAPSAAPNEQLAATAARLVFVEAEQMLVVGTEAGWRPVQLLAPLRDFRKAIAKFSLSSPEDRRRLMSLSSGRRTAASGNSIKPLRRHEGASVSGARGQQTSYDGQPSYADESDADADQDAIVDEDEQDDDDDKEDDDYDEDDDEDDEDDMEDNEVGANDLASGDQQRQARQRLTATVTSGSNQTPTPTAATSSTSSQLVSGRSATAAALVSGSMLGDNSAGKLQQRQQSPTAESPSRRANSDAPTADRRIMKLRMAALNEPFSGNVHGIRGADFECKRNAAKANIKGSFRAFLAAGFQSLNEVIRYNVHKYPIVNLRGETLANSWHDLFKQPARIANPLSRIYSFDGRHVATDSKWPNKLVWHGAANKAGYRDLQQNCDGWHSDSLNKFGLATPVHPPRAGMKTRRQRKRYLAELAATQTINGSSNQAASTTNSINNQTGEHGGSAFLEGIEKYPCRMPLIVLCVETIGQQFSEQQWDNSRRLTSKAGNLIIDGSDESSDSNNAL